ncbi:DNA-directed RNA polymerase subunit alpha [Amygdalobacter indicium]|jgi:hypothetical protein|uniref:DNA-directed RNA polymerase subunit alpha n=1 Tax=Amygdalobacter indicium TaxID=3029272 RepID=A0ABY8C542_9FIRM|nr:DNA-directed RNA polymerase subunit alpha [Amygdalobacter indicium]WEG34233.1 DNA-directed RNA polymerase subunit alpha [Amygdalobacter indicium]WEG35815.1 DNA-directed RNA polymerase subunit alpha [Amygdalobacter indicium]
MLDTNRPNIETVELSSDKSYGRFVIEPLERGYGQTLGNSLRRVLLSSLPGSAVTSLRVDNVLHEFSTVKGVVQDMTEIILNVKGIRTRMHVDAPKTIYLARAEGFKGDVYAGDITTDEEVEIMNPDHLICTMNGSERLFAEFTVTNGTGYNTAEQNKWVNQPIGVIAIDSIFTPIKRVKYAVEDTRVGQVTDFDRLTMEVWTDGTIEADKALAMAASILIEQLSLFKDLSGNIVINEPSGKPVAGPEYNEVYDTAIEDLDFSVRTYNCLKRANINTLGDLAVRSEDEMMKVRNLGKKSLEEVMQKMKDLGFALSKGETENE